MNRSRIWAALGTAAFTGILVATTEGGMRHRNPALPTVEGAGVQNGWIMDGVFDGTTLAPAESPGKFAAWLQHLFPALAEDRSDCVNYTPDFLGLRVRVPKGESDFSFVGCTSDGREFTFANRTKRPWPNNDFLREEYLPLPALAGEGACMNVIVNDSENRPLATWRVANLPRLIHHDFGPVTKGEIKLADGGTVAGKAWVDTEDNRLAWQSYWWDLLGGAYPNGTDDGRKPVWVEVRVAGSAASPRNRYWIASEPALTEEWDTQSGRPQSLAICQRLTTDTGRPETGIRFLGLAARFPEEQHTVQVAATAQEHLLLSDTVRFRNVPLERRGDGWYMAVGARGVTKTSANGVAVSLLPIAPGGYFGHLPLKSSPNEVRFRFATKDGGVPQPGSPLYHQSPGAIEISRSLVSVPNDTADTFNATDIDERGYLRPNVHTGILTLKHAPDATGCVDISMSFQEDAVVKTVPFQITLPVSPNAPQNDLLFPDLHM